MENNKLIAEFMGYRECPMKLYRMNDEFEDITIYSTFQDEDEYLTIESGKIQIKFSPNQMRFHESWDWLMPVVEKIESFQDGEDGDSMGGNLYNFRIEQYFVYILDGESMDHIIEMNGDSKIDATYKAVVEFIKWHNKNK